MREKVGKSRNMVFFRMICGSGGSKSRLAKAAGAEPAGQMRRRGRGGRTWSIYIYIHIYYAYKEGTAIIPEYRVDNFRTNQQGSLFISFHITTGENSRKPQLCWSWDLESPWMAYRLTVVMSSRDIPLCPGDLPKSGHIVSNPYMKLLVLLIGKWKVCTYSIQRQWFPTATP